MDDYSMRRSGSVGHEVLADGQVIAWTVDGWWAAMIVGLLNRAETEGLGRHDISGYVKHLTRVETV